MHGINVNEPAPGVVEYKDAKAVKLSGMRKELLDRAKDDGYDFGLIVRSLDLGAPPEDAGFSIQDLLANGKMIIPALIYKVYADGRDEIKCAAQKSGLPSIRDLREMIASKESLLRTVC